MSGMLCSASGCNCPIAQLDEFVECRGDCIKRFHVRCAGIQTAAVKYITNNKNVVYMCDECLNNINEPNEMDAKYDAVLELLQKILTTVNTDKSEIIKKIDNLPEMRKNEQKINKTKTLSEIIKSGSSSSVLIKPKKTDQRSDETKSYVKDKINPTDIAVNGIRKIAKGAIIVECTNKVASDKLIKKLNENLSENYEVKKTEAKKPRIKIIGLSTKDENAAIVNYIKTQNDGLEKAEMKVIKVFENKQRRSYNCILEVDGDTFKKLMNGERKIFIGWDRCAIVECLDLLRCYNCSGFQHRSVDCKRRKACPRCSESHDLKECKSEKRECTNCKFAVDTYRLNLDVRHESWSTDCPTFLRRLNVQRSKTAYD